MACNCVVIEMTHICQENGRVNEDNRKYSTPSLLSLEKTLVIKSG